MFRHFLLCPSDTAMCCRCPPCDYVLSNRSPISKRVHCNCAVFVLYHYCIFTLSPLYLYCICTLSLLYLYCTCTLSLLYLYCICTLLCFITTVSLLWSLCSPLHCVQGYCPFLTFSVLPLPLSWCPVSGQADVARLASSGLDHCAFIRHF